MQYRQYFYQYEGRPENYSIYDQNTLILFNFDNSGVGRLAAVWGISTLIFIPFGILFDRKIGRMKTIIVGTITAAFGLVIIAWLGLNPFDLKSVNLSLYQNSLLIFLFVFGMGLGLMTTSSTALMLDVTAVARNKTLLLSVFGLSLTLSRSGASFITALIMVFNNYQLLFLIESSFLLLATIPLYLVYINLRTKNIVENKETLEIFNLADIA